jgi:hypothetical protein
MRTIENILNCLSWIDFLHDIKFQELKLVHKIEADNFTLTTIVFRQSSEASTKQTCTGMSSYFAFSGTAVRSDISPMV